MSGEAKLPGELDAGAFGTWLLNATEAIAGRAAADVPCGDCAACCQSSQFVHVGRDETRSLTEIPVELLFPAAGRAIGDRLMGYDEQGRCPMLVERQCVIYQNRPVTCKSYDCRVFPAAAIAPSDNENPLIAKQAERWVFQYPQEDDRQKHRAVQAAAQHLREHPELLDASGSTSTKHLAVCAIRIHTLFLQPPNLRKGAAALDTAAALNTAIREILQ
jgi:hypothetical protein